MGSLDGLKILDFSTLLPGPYATLMLADMGAEVLKISSQSRKDIVADFPPFIDKTGLSANQAWLGRNKKNMFLNLKKPEAIQIVKKLIMEYDIIMEQFRPGVMEKLGLGYETLREINKRLIYCSLTGYGQTGPLRNRAGHDINYLARSGNMSYSGKLETGPVLTNMQIADLAVGSLHSVAGILAAVNYRNNTGLGQSIDVSMYDGLIPFHAMEGTGFLAAAEIPKREGQRLNGGCLYDFYETKDGQYLSVGCLEPQFFKNFCLCIERPQYIDGTVWPENVAEVKADIKGVLRSKTREEWEAVFAGKDVCVEPVLSLDEALLKDGHMKDREMVVEVEVPLSGGKRVKQLGTAMKLSACPIEYKSGGYPLGYHTAEIMASIGYTEDEIEKMEQDGMFD